MGEPVTKETCEVCGDTFEMPMAKARRSGGYVAQNAILGLYYCDNEEFELEQVCTECFDEINEAVETTLGRLRKKQKSK